MKLPNKENNKNLLFGLILLFTDICAYFSGVIAAYFSRIIVGDIFELTDFVFPLEYFIFELWWIFLIFIGTLLLFGLYRKKLPYWQEARELTKATVVTFILAFALVSISKYSDYISRLTLIFLLIYSTMFIIIFRLIVKSILGKNKLFSDVTIIIGDTLESTNVAKLFNIENNLGINIIGNVSPNIVKNSRSSKLKCLGSIANVEKIIQKYNVTSAVILQSSIEDSKLSSLVGKLQVNLSKILLISSSTEAVALSNAEPIETLMTNLSYLQINNNIRSYKNRVIKRGIDLFLCALSLPFLLLITLLIIIAIKINSRGAAFYTHERVGRGGRVIKVIKFRSMYIDSAERLEKILATDPKAKKEWNANFKLKNDPRVTKVGSFLRKTSLDELPQVFNVIVGDMSLIGPRPVIKKELEMYYKDFTSYYTLVRPGITGLWQVSGRSDTNYDFRIHRDSWYVLNWSVWLDLTILLLTPAVVLKRKGAY